MQSDLKKHSDFGRRECCLSLLRHYRRECKLLLKSRCWTHTDPTRESQCLSA